MTALYDYAGARKRAHLSQDRLAELMRDAGHSSWRQNTVSRVESGSQQPTHAEAVTLSTLLDADLSVSESARGTERFADIADRGDRRTTLVALRRLVAEQIERCDTSRDMPPLVSRFLDVERELHGMPDPDGQDDLDRIMSS